MAEIAKVREEAIGWMMRVFDMDRADAESFADHSEGRLFDLDDTFSLGEPFDVDIGEQMTQLIRRKNECRLCA